MKVILTHDQADFDALAAQLAASLLEEGAIPVLPHKLNRNVRSFLNLYGTELPYMEMDDLPRDEIESIILVDTQSMITMRSMKPAFSVKVIDHHPARVGLPADWKIQTSKVGATTTILVEDLMQRDEPIDAVAATLLLLGIYEDTGSFQYASTTSRDIQAVAFLLDHGANLKLAVEFLNPPLSATQRELYDHLLNSARTSHIQGFNITIATATALELIEEISSVAHKLRDLLDPDALFLIAATREGIRIIARSARDEIDVAAILSFFHGGGHERAAAALIPTISTIDPNKLEESLASIQQQLVDVLEKNIQPAATVSQVMSRRPMTLKPDTSLEEAATLMQRYGYEGFPVVDDSGVVGLLTRRNVDRAMAHKLRVKTSEIMETGSVSVQPGDSLNTLQKIMAETGWGQIPVYDLEKGKLVGIVTRTDLLRFLAADEGSRKTRRNLANELDAYLPAATSSLLKIIAGKAVTLGYPIYLVGGIVRDLLLKRPGADLDIVVEGDAIRLAKSLIEEYGGHQVSHGRFGTAKWIIKDIQDRFLGLPGFSTSELGEGFPDRVDLISSRTEYYEYPSALPTVERGSIKLDLFRRDFTINTLAIRLDGTHYGELHDYWGGWDDLHQGLIRVLHPLSFIDDPTRLLRAVRFEQRFGFRIEDRTMGLIQRAVPLLEQISGQRARHELDLFFEETRFSQMLERASKLGLLEAIHPELTISPERLELIRSAWILRPEKEWEIPDPLFSLPRRTALVYLSWLSHFAESESISACNRLRLTADFTSALRQVHHGRKSVEKLFKQRPSHIVSHLEKISSPALFILFSEASESYQKELIWNYLTLWRKVKPLTKGEDLQNLGIPAGPMYKKILARLRSAWLDGEVDSAEQEQEYLCTLIEQLGSNNNT